MGDNEEAKALYVGNLHPYVNEAVLQDIFSTLGAVSEVRIVKDRATGNSAGSAFVKFEDHQAAAIALKTINGRVLYNKEVRIQWAFQKEKTENTASHFHIFVGNLSGDVADPVLLQAFQHIGECSDARVMWDHSTGRSKGFGFVSFRTKEAAEKALVEMNEATVGQWKIRCGWAHHKTEAVTGLDAETVDRADPANTNVYVGNLASEVTEEDLRAEFGAFGEITGLKPCHKGGYGFVTFRDHSAAVQAIVGMNGKDLKGKVLKCSWGRHQSKTGSGGAVGASMPLLSGLPGGQLLGGFSAAGALGLQQGQHMYNGQLTQPAAYAALPGQLPYQGQMDYMATSAQLQAVQYGQFAAQQQYQQQPGLLYGAQQLAAAQYSPYSPQQPQPQGSPAQLTGLAYPGQQYPSAAGQQAQMSAAPFASQQPLSNSYYAQY
ncbi:Oligouridylate-binding protein 1 [Coccomyxa sp. Obi]|nr:Oligouridylate-binding protein 1 [Coccomyxa sp. Obi]